MILNEVTKQNDVALFQTLLLVCKRTMTGLLFANKAMGIHDLHFSTQNVTVLTHAILNRDISP